MDGGDWLGKCIIIILFPCQIVSSHASVGVLSYIRDCLFNIAVKEEAGNGSTGEQAKEVVKCNSAEEFIWILLTKARNLNGIIIFLPSPLISALALYLRPSSPPLPPPPCTPSLHTFQMNVKCVWAEFFMQFILKASSYRSHYGSSRSFIQHSY